VSTDLLLRVNRSILAHPESYNQGQWCGTACCIGGHAVIAVGIDPKVLESVASEAQRLLDLTDEQVRVTVSYR